MFSNTLYMRLCSGRHVALAVTDFLTCCGWSKKWRERCRDTWRSIRHGPLSRRCLRATDTRRDWPVALFNQRDRRWDTFNCPSLCGSSSRF